MINFVTFGFTVHHNTSSEAHGIMEVDDQLVLLDCHSGVIKTRYNVSDRLLQTIQHKGE